MDDLRALRAANESFYRSFSELDLPGMLALWSGQPGDVCVHPGWEIQRGAAVAESWRAILGARPVMQFQLSEVRADVAGDTAWVTCVENIHSLVEGRSIRARVAATNLFRRIDGQWRMVLHHGSPIAGSSSVTEVPDDVN